MPVIWKKIARNVPWRAAQMAIMLLIAQVRPWDMASPLASAWLCAGMGGGYFAPRWLGLALGASGWTLPLIASAAAALRRISGVDRRLSAEQSCMLAGCLSITEAAVSSGGAAGQCLQWLLCGMLASALTLPMLALERGHIRREHALDWRKWVPASVGLAVNAGALQFPGRRRTQPVSEPEKRLPLRLPERERLEKIGRAALAVGISVGAAELAGGYAGLAAAAVILAQWPGAQAEWTGILLAAALGLCGVPLSAAAAMIVLRLALQHLAQWGRPVQLLGSLAVSGAWLLAGGAPDAIWQWAALIPAAATVWLLPEKLSRGEIACDELADQQRTQAQMNRKIHLLADALADMTRPRPSGPDPPREDALLLSLRTRLCDGCVRYERCWNGRAGEGLRLLCELITRSANGALPEKVLPDMMRRCLRANIIPDRLYAELNRFSALRSVQMARLDGARRAQLAIESAVETLRAMAQAPDAGIRPEDLRAAEVSLRCGGVDGARLTLSLDGLAVSRREGWTQKASQRACRICGGALGRRYEFGSSAGRMLWLREAPGLVARTGWDGVPAAGGSSGDCVFAGALDDRRQLVVISDGMGTGPDAAGESAKAVQAVCRFLRAGIAPERAARLANQRLVNESSGEIFATLDLCVIDNQRMEAIWVKMAACDSYLFREHDCSVISGGKLPMGILAQAEPQVICMRLQPGDVIVMGSDGAMEELDPDTAQRCLIRNRQATAGELARWMRLAAEGRLRHGDDRTVAVVRMERARAKSGESA